MTLRPPVASSSGKVAQIVTASTAAVSTTTAQIPFDDTIPQNTEGAEFLTCSITPQNAANTLFIFALLHVSVVTSDVINMALFQDANANALAVASFWEPTSTGNVPLVLEYSMPAGGVAATTFKLRAGPSTAARTITVNGISGARKFGGALISMMKITEVAP